MKNVTHGWGAVLAAIAIAVGAAVVVEAQRYEVTPLDSAQVLAAPIQGCGEAIPGPRRQRGLLTLVTSSGAIQGDGPDDTIEVFGLSHAVVQLVDPQTGLPQGKAQRGELVITKTVDRSSPLLMKALVLKESVLQAELRLNDGSGAYDYTIVLENGYLTGFETRMLRRCTGGFAHLEEIAFTCRRITYRHEPTGIEFEDDGS